MGPTKTLTKDLIFQKTKNNNYKTITKLNLWGHSLSNVDALEDMTGLQVLSLSINEISSLKPFKNLMQLKELYLRKNNISSLDELQYLSNLQQLSILWLSENPIENNLLYRKTVVKFLPNLQKLDDKAITEEERNYEINFEQKKEKFSRQQLEDDRYENKKLEQMRQQEEIKQRELQNEQIKKQLLENEKQKRIQKQIEERQRAQTQSLKQSKSSNVLPAIMFLLEELNQMELEILRKEIEKKLIHNQLIMRRLIIRNFSKQILPESDIVKHPKFQNDKQIRQQAKITSEMLNQQKPQELKSSSIKIINAKTMKPQQIFLMINTDFNSFFKEREINRKNFNLLLQAIVEQKNLSRAEEVFEKMHFYGIEPNISSYTFMIEVAGKAHDLVKSNLYFDQCVGKYGWNIFSSNAMIYSYAKNNEFTKAMNIFTLSKLYGLQINCVIYSTLIMAAYNEKKIDTCWYLFEEMQKLNIEKDDIIQSFMIKVCARTNDAEKGLKMWNEMLEMKDLRLNCLHYNSIIKTLSNRRDYCQQALEFYDEMIEKKIQPDLKTFEYTLTACAQLGNIKMAYELTQSLKSFNMEPNMPIFSSLVKTYATAIQNPKLPHKLKESFLQDAWEMVNKLIKGKRKISVNLLNNLLSCHVNIDQVNQAEETVLPLLAEHNLEPNSNTYQIFFQKFFQLGEYKRITDLYEKLHSQNPFLITHKSLNICLKVFYIQKNIEKIVEILDIFIERKHRPSVQILKQISDSENLPDVIFVRLKCFPYQARTITSQRYYGKNTSLREHRKEYFDIQEQHIEPMIDGDFSSIQQEPKKYQKKFHKTKPLKQLINK